MTTDYDGEEVQPHRQEEIGLPVFLSLFFLFISHALHVCQAELARRTGCIHHTVKIPMYKRTLSAKGREIPYEDIVAEMCFGSREEGRPCKIDLVLMTIS